MKKKDLTCVLVLALLCLGLFAGYRQRMRNKVNDFQPMQIMVEGKIYIHSSGAKKERPEGTPDGVITKVNYGTDYPDADGEANFGTLGTPYWKTPEGICVSVNNKYLLFKNQE